jgi:hypothetical protein
MAEQQAGSSTDSHGCLAAEQEETVPLKQNRTRAWLRGTNPQNLRRSSCIERHTEQERFGALEDCQLG